LQLSVGLGEDADSIYEIWSPIGCVFGKAAEVVAPVELRAAFVRQSQNQSADNTTNRMARFHIKWDSQFAFSPRTGVGAVRDCPASQQIRKSFFKSVPGSGAS
jgi:hypothetical protein